MDKQFIKRVRLKDRIATRVITVGGMLIIASVIAILLLIVNVTLPLFMPARAKLVQSVALPATDDAEARAVGIDDYREIAYVLDDHGRVRFFSVADGRSLDTFASREDIARRIVAVVPFKNNHFSLLWDDQLATLLQVSFSPRFDEEGQRSIIPAISIVASLEAAELPTPALESQIRLDEEGTITRVDLLSDNRLAVTRQATSTSLFGDETTESFFYLIEDNLPGRITAYTLNSAGTALFAGTDQGTLLRWSLSEHDNARRTDISGAVTSSPAITALSLVLGDVSVAVGTAHGGLATWMPVRADSKSNIKKYRPIHSLHPHPDQVALIVPSQRHKTLISLSKSGAVHFDHTTSENHLMELGEHITMIGADDRGSSLATLDRHGRLQIWSISNPHPEINFATLFTKVWYENYDEPQYVWQSSAGSDDFEPKFSLIPLLFGTVKGTLYAMIFAVPLAIFGAVYTSQFTTPFFKRTVKPVIEIMASIPSVVIGFLIALWLAPIIEETIIAALLSLVIIPLCFFLCMAIYQPISQNMVWRQRIKGYEFLLMLPVIVLAMAVANAIGHPLEDWLFGGEFKTWLFSTAGMHYDQRNCIIIAFGLGIAVIPIIFSITEDAISNIPASLSAASLALGASRWQTVWRVVLPSASPGIFAAIMIGFGRVVGETMIVLMATGNTPVLDWSIFNGMRTLSANIAVEIPEAPVGGTLYRVLFLCATLLFCLTFILNTAAEVVRERLRKKYGRY